MPKWLKSASFYEIYPQSFCDSNGDGIGDIRGIISKLDYISDMGFNSLWLNPCFESPFMDAGYDVQDYYKVAARYGTNEDLAKLFEEAHSREIRVLLDLVPGHTSDKCEWFADSCKPQRNDNSDTYIWTDSVWHRPLEYGSVAGMADRDGCYLVNFFTSQPALNYGFDKITDAKWQISYQDSRAEATLEKMMNVMRYWLDMGCDGFRVDMADSLVKNDDSKHATASLWRKVRAMLDNEYPDACIISEWCNAHRAIGMAGFHADFMLHHEGNITHYAFRNKDNNGINNSYFADNCQGKLSNVLDKYVEDLKAIEGKGYMCLISGNHDVLRLSQYLDVVETKLAYMFIYTMPCVPFMYYGDEIAMRYLAQDSYEGGYHRTGSRTPMQWNGDNNLGFSATEGALYLDIDRSADAPTVSMQQQDPDSLLNHVKRLNAIRKEYVDLQADGEFELLYSGEEGYPFAYRRGELAVAINATKQQQTIPVCCCELIYCLGQAVIDGDSLILPPQSALIGKLK